MDDNQHNTSNIRAAILYWGGFIVCGLILSGILFAIGYLCTLGVDQIETAIKAWDSICGGQK